MAGIVQNANGEFWRAPVLPTEAGAATAEALAESCARCGSEFVMGAAFCHVCGLERRAIPETKPALQWQRYFAWAHHLEFHHIQERLGLPTLSLVAFIAGIACALAAVLVGVVFSANTVLDWQAIQAWRIQWLLGSAAAFLAGILLRR